MKKLLILSIVILLLITLSGCKNKIPENMVLVKGGAFKNTNSNYYNIEANIHSFYIGKYEVTQKEWVDVMGYNPSAFIGDDLPVEMISWYDAVEYCNKRSLKEGLEPYYNINKNILDPHNISEYDTIKWTVTINDKTNGYRLPTEIEWEYAASGGQLSENFTYSGSNEVDEAAWYWRNAGDSYITGDWSWSLIENNQNKTHIVGGKLANELGLFDMSGNVREWCYDWYQDSNIPTGMQRIWKGGGWIGDATSSAFSYRGKFEANGMGADHGFRICRNK